MPRGETRFHLVGLTRHPLLNTRRWRGRIPCYQETSEHLATKADIASLCGWMIGVGSALAILNIVLRFVGGGS